MRAGDEGTSEDDTPIHEALNRLGELIEARVHRERLRDQLTGLPNDLALSEFLEEHVESDAMWVAFVEIDKFKSINDKFGYEDANMLLAGLAGALLDSAAAFGHGGRAFRAHGDEFYVAGLRVGTHAYADRVIAGNLDLLRQDVQDMSVAGVSLEEAMKCTVTIAWLTASDLAKGVASDRAIRDHLEMAMAVAKERRNCVVRYHASMQRRLTDSYRADCGACRTKFSLDVPCEADGHDRTLHCPHCGNAVDRPPRASLPPSAPTPPRV